MINTKILRPGYTQRGTLELLLHTDPQLDIQDIEDVYYPYIRLRYLITVGKGKRAKKLNKFSDCVIDRVSGSTYESKGNQPYFEDMEIEEESSLEAVYDLAECYDIGHDFTLKQYIGKAKLMYVPQMQIIEEDVFHKLFYIVTCLDANGSEYYILVDAVDGGVSILDYEKYEKEQMALEEAKKLLSEDVEVENQGSETP